MASWDSRRTQSSCARSAEHAHPRRFLSAPGLFPFFGRMKRKRHTQYVGAYVRDRYVLTHSCPHSRSLVEFALLMSGLRLCQHRRRFSKRKHVWTPAVAQASPSIFLSRESHNIMWRRIICKRWRQTSCTSTFTVLKKKRETARCRRGHVYRIPPPSRAGQQPEPTIHLLFSRVPPPATSVRRRTISVLGYVRAFH